MNKGKEIFTNKKYFLFLVFGIFIGIIFSVASILLNINTRAEITYLERKKLSELGTKAAIQKEVPVASLLMYNHKIIGMGHNTVLHDTNVAAHAEVNAINDAIKNIGFDNYYKLKTDSLVLITTFEPCPMCKGAMAENHIEQVVIVQKKSLEYRLKEWKRYLVLNNKMRFTKVDLLQDSLFRIFPEVDMEQIKY